MLASAHLPRPVRPLIDVTLSQTKNRSTYRAVNFFVNVKFISPKVP